MTMPSERTRSVIQAAEFLKELSKDLKLPEDIRTEANRLLRHFPSKSEVLRAGKIEEAAEGIYALIGPVFSSTVK